VLRTIVEGIEHGVFPCVLEPPDSWPRRWRSYADPDARGTRDRYREWARKSTAPEIEPFLRLATAGDTDDESDEQTGGLS
jgi:hypothetical protein